MVGQRAAASGPFAMTVRQLLDGILAYFETKLTSGAIEAINGIIQLPKRMAGI